MTEQAVHHPDASSERRRHWLAQWLFLKAATLWLADMERRLAAAECQTSTLATNKIDTCAVYIHSVFKLISKIAVEIWHRLSGGN